MTCAESVVTHCGQMCYSNPLKLIGLDPVNQLFLKAVQYSTEKGFTLL